MTTTEFTTGGILACTILYMFCGIIMFLGVLKEAEKGDSDFYKNSRPIRITVRLCYVLIWPAVLLMMFGIFVYRILKLIWDSLTE